MSIVIISGSKSDAHIMKKVTDVLEAAQVTYQSFVVSAHRDPELLDQILKETRDAQVYICIAGLSAALPGVVASKTTQPVIGVPVSSALGGLDALLSIAQMPKGVPVATVGIDNGANAAHLALRIIGKSVQVTPSTYAAAGVDREREEAAVEAILALTKETLTDYILPAGHYAGAIKFQDSALSLATDGVGTKLLLAQELGKLDTIGIDAVAMNVNDLITTGSIPVAFVDYLAICEPDSVMVAEIMKGLVAACKESDIPLIGGETAILPDILRPNTFDVAGTALGIHKTDQTITGELIQPGDSIIGIASSGVHSNGYSLARRLVAPDLKHELLTPTRLYVRCIRALLESDLPVHGMAHITGGGFTNLLRLGDFHYALRKWDIPDIFVQLQRNGDIANREMYRTFNMGIGYLVITAAEHADAVVSFLNQFFPTQIIGTVQTGKKVTIDMLEVS